MRIAVLGAGYTGRAVTLDLVRAGHEVIAIGRREAPVLALAAAGGDAVAPRVADTRDPGRLRAALDGADRLIHLAPPPSGEVPEDDAGRVMAALPRGVDRVVYGSTTGVFAPPEHEEWVDENSPAGPRGRLGTARLAYETALLDHAPGPVHVVRIAGIYGPGRTLAPRIEDRSLVLFEDGPPTSRIHREDLARLLVAVALADAPPPRVVATDEAPVPTAEVAAYTARLLGVAPPELLPLDEARQKMSSEAIELRLGGKRCRSLFREGLIGPLRHPSYREGVRASLLEEGRTLSEP